MTGIWKTWMRLWCLAVGGFGLVLTFGAWPPTDAPTRFLFDLLDGPRELVMTDHLRFSLAVMGPVTLGWCITLFGAIRAVEQLDHAAARPVWFILTLATLTWFTVDSILSVATGFWPNLIPNTIYVAAFLVPVLASGVLSQSDRQGPPGQLAD